MQTIGITGGTGFIGHHLAKLLAEQGYRVIVYTREMHLLNRQEKVKYSYWCPDESKFDLSYFKELNAVIHLAGAAIDKRWTAKRKEDIVNSRVQGTNFLVEKLKEHAPNCKLLIAASAIGFYGPDKESRIPFHEDNPPANDFLANTCRLWEEASHKAEEIMRTVILRFGIVLGEDDGVFPQFSKPQDFGLVPIIGNGKQTVSWIHIDDLCSIMLWGLKHQEMSGTYNAVAPHPVAQKELMKVIATAKKGLKLPVYVPDIALRLRFGEMASEALKSTTASADKILGTGFEFRYPQIEQAVDAILQRSDTH